MERIGTALFTFEVLALFLLATRAGALGPGVAFTSPQSLAVQPDGKVVVVGNLDDRVQAVGMARYNADGSYDATFGSAGIVATTTPGATDNYGTEAYAVAVDVDGDIAVAGRAWNDPSFDFFVARYDSSGNPDTTFGDVGYVRTDLGLLADESAVDVQFQSDGKILVVGRGILRYTASGDLDPDFALSGVLTVFGVDFRQVELLPDGRLLALGIGAAGDNHIRLYRFDANGQPDPGFGVGGFAGSAGSSLQAAFGVQDDGKIVLALSNGLLRRYTEAGETDFSFDTDGVLFPSPLTSIISTAGVITTNDEILVAGDAPGHDWPVIVRLNSAGALDPSFGDSGIAETTRYFFQRGSGSSTMGRSLSGQVMGAAYASTYTWSYNFSLPAVFRFTPAGTEDSSFGIHGAAFETLCYRVPVDAPACIEAAASTVGRCVRGADHTWWSGWHSALRWKWRGATSGSPALTGQDSAYALCIHDTSASGSPLPTALVVPGFGWTSVGDGKGWKYRNRSRYKKESLQVFSPPSPGMPSARGRFEGGIVSFSNSQLFEVESGVIIRLVNSDGLCWKASFSGDQILANDDRCFKAGK